jgi:tetratricopeptide (TPR) repeat protein
MLELADTLCNIGGLCLEWIRQQGPHSQHATDAESSFAEALHIRREALGEQHALTNQVRALHDMARSIPLPKPTATMQAPRSPGGRSTATTTVHANVAPRPRYPQYSIPAKSTKSPGREQQRTSPGQLNNSKTLQMPELEDEQNKQDLRPRSNTVFNSGSDFADTFDSRLSKEEESMIEAEENCLLQPESAGQTSTLISYAQTTSKYTASAQKQNDRSALLNNARAMLNIHDDSVGSPLRTLGARERTSPGPLTPRRNLSQDEGLAPLGGNWPASNNNRITPTVLEHPDRHLNTIHKCATSFMKRGKYVEALHLLELIAECQRDKHGSTHEDVAAALYNVGICYLRMNEHYKALQSFEEATRIRQTVLGRDSPQVAASLVKVGVSLMQLKRLEDSVWIFREALSVRKTVLGNLHPLTARIYNNIGCVHVELKQFDQAHEAFESALRIQRNVLTHNPNNGPALFAVATTLQNMGFWYQKRGMHEKAVDALTEALQFQEKALGRNHGTVVATLETIAEACLADANTSLALKYYKEVLGRLDSSHSTIQEATTLYKISRVNLQNNELESQLRSLQMASNILQSDSSTKKSRDRVELEQRIQRDLNTSREMMNKPNLNWV